MINILIESITISVQNNKKYFLYTTKKKVPNNVFIGCLDWAPNKEAWTLGKGFAVVVVT